MRNGPTIAIPSPDGEFGLNRYLAQIPRFPYLTLDEEMELALRYRESGDADAAAKLVTSHLRMVAKMAMRFRGYGLPTSDLISEGNLGLMRSVSRFEPGKGFRVSTYAMWWVRASMQDYVLRSWSLVKLGTTVAQKKLFFNLRRLKSVLQAYEEGGLSPGHADEIAERLHVSTGEVHIMNQRMSAADASLNVGVGEDGDACMQDWLVDTRPLQDAVLAERQETSARHDLLSNSLGALDARERHILMERRLKDEPTTLEVLSVHHGVSRERIRQIEMRAFAKLQRDMTRRAKGDGLSAAAA